MGACLGAPETMQQTRQKKFNSKNGSCNYGFLVGEGFNYNVTIEKGRAHFGSTLATAAAFLNMLEEYDRDRGSLSENLNKGPPSSSFT